MDDASELRLSVGSDEVGVLSVSRAVRGSASAVLSEAERGIATLVVEGKTNAAIARARRTSPHTVANQIQSMFEKLGVGSRTALAQRLTRGE